MKVKVQRRAGLRAMWKAKGPQQAVQPGGQTWISSGLSHGPSSSSTPPCTGGSACGCLLPLSLLAAAIMVLIIGAAVVRHHLDCYALSYRGSEELLVSGVIKKPAGLRQSPITAPN